MKNTLILATSLILLTACSSSENDKLMDAELLKSGYSYSCSGGCDEKIIFNLGKYIETDKQMETMEFVKTKKDKLGITTPINVAWMTTNTIVDAPYPVE